jgi:ATP-dependent Clp protease ATP-binding subunit ClpX
MPQIFYISVCAFYRAFYQLFTLRVVFCGEVLLKKRLHACNGRLPVFASLDPLDRDALVRILTQPKNAVAKQFSRLLDMDGVDLTFEDGALEAIADQAVAKKLGARGLRAMLEQTLMDHMFELPDPGRTERLHLVVTRAEVEGKLKTAAGSREPAMDEPA